MKQTIEIEVPDGKKAIWKDNKRIFEGIKPQLPKTWEEFCNNTKIQAEESYVGADSNIYTQYIPEYRQPLNKVMLPNKEAAEQHLALMQLHQLRDCYRQGWVPNWSDKNNKYYIIHLSNTYSITAANIGVIAFLSFQSKELAKEFLNNFKDLIKQAGDLI